MKEVYTGIVIKSIDYGASDRIITILTSDDSFVVFKARGVNKMSSSLMKYTIPFSISEFELESKSEKSNKVLTSASAIYFPSFTSSNIKGIALSSYISESLNYFDTFNGLYKFITSLIKSIDEGENESLLFLNYLYFLIKCNGLSLFVDGCEVCGSKKNIVDVDYSVGGFLCSSHSINRKSNEYIELLYKVSHSKGLYLEAVDEGTLFNLIKDLIFFFNENSGMNIRSEKFVLNSLFNM